MLSRTRNLTILLGLVGLNAGLSVPVFAEQNCCQYNFGCGSSKRLTQARCERGGGTFVANSKCVVGTGMCGPKTTGDVEPECSPGVPLDVCCDGTGFDVDSCQVSVEQIDWKDGDDLFLLDGFNSRFVQVTFHYGGLNVLDWGQVVIDGVWVVQNLPLPQMHGDDADESVTVIVDIGTLPGTNINSVNVYATITDTMQSSAPVAPVITALPVTDVVHRQGGTSHAGGTAVASPALQVSPGTFAFHPPQIPPCEIKLRPYMPNMNVKWNHCAPGAVANAFENMKKRTGLPLDQTQQEIYDKLRGEMMTTKNGGTELSPTNKLVEGKIAFLQEKGLQGEVTVISRGPWFGGQDFDPMELFQWMCDGYEVELEYGYVYPSGGWKGGHTVVVAGVAKCGDEICVLVRSDHDQDLKTYQPPDYPDERPEGIDQWDWHCFNQVSNVCHDDARNASAVCTSDADCIGTCSGDYSLNCTSDLDCFPFAGSCAGRDCVDRWELTNEGLNQVRGAVAQCPENPDPIPQPPTWVVDTVASSLSGAPVFWSSGTWTKNGNPIDDTFPAPGTLTGGPSDASVGDQHQLPITPNDFHYTVSLPFLGIPKTVRVNFKNLPTDQQSSFISFPLEVYVSQSISEYEITIDWRANVYTIRDTAADQVVWSNIWIGGLGYPLNLPPEYQPTGAVRNFEVSVPCPCYGDVNADGFLNVADLNSINECSGSQPEVPCSLADVNCDATIDSDDFDVVVCMLDGGTDCCGCGACALFGDMVDVNSVPMPDCLVDVSDLLCTLDDFTDPLLCAGNADLVSADFSCGPDGVVDVSDLLSVLDAFSGIYACSHPCAPDPVPATKAPRVSRSAPPWPFR